MKRFATKLLLIPGAAALAFLLVIAVGMVTGHNVGLQIDRIEARYLPMIELRPRLEADLEHMRQGFQDAVAAQDNEAVDAVRTHKLSLLRALDENAEIVRPADLAIARAALTAYFDTGRAVSRRLIAGETGESVVDAMGQMQLAHGRAADAVARATAFERKDLDAAFLTLRAANTTAQRASLGIATACMALVLALAVMMGRGVARSLAELSSGFARFGEGHFDQPMVVRSEDELGEAARNANAMAAKLDQGDRQRRAAEWVKMGQAGLALELQGDHEPSALARRVIVFVARYMGALAGAVYVADDGGALVCLATYAGDDAEPRRFAPGEGLIGEAARDDRLIELAAPAVVRAGVGDLRPATLVLVPVRDQGRTLAVLELALPRALTDEGRELLATMRGNVATGVSVAQSQAARRDLLAKTQLQAARLAEQEEHLIRANAALEAKQADLEKAVEGLERQTAELDSFTYSVSHDLRAPLRAIDGFTRILMEDHAASLDDEGKRVANVVRANTQKMGQLIDDLLAFSRLGRQSVKLGPVDMTALVREVFAEAVAAEPQRKIVLDLPADLPPAVGDPALLRQVWSNLLANAVKYTRPREEARIAVSGRVDDDHVRYAVRDNGVGFDMKYAHKLFGVFQRLHGANEFEGTGVGLALVNRVVQKHGGKVHAESAAGGGATFSFTLPTTGVS